MDDRPWRVVVDFGPSAGVDDDEQSARTAAFAGAVEDLVAEDEVTYDDARVFAYVHAEAEAMSLRDSLRERLASGGSSANLSVARWDEQAGIWRNPDGSPAPTRYNRNVRLVRPGERVPAPRSRTEISFGDRRFAWTSGRASLRARLIRLAIVVVFAAAGVIWYVSAPGVASYNLGSLFVVPPFIWLLWRLRRLPSLVKWTGAVTLAVAGTTGYLIVGGSQWWYWGQFAIWPLVLLIFDRGKTQVGSESWYGGPMEGPWGPP